MGVLQTHTEEELRDEERRANEGLADLRRNRQRYTKATYDALLKDKTRLRAAIIVELGNRGLKPATDN